MEMEIDRVITVCSACLRACCWQGIFYCNDYQTAGTVERTVEELRTLNRESWDYWVPVQPIVLGGRLAKRPRLMM